MGLREIMKQFWLLVDTPGTRYLSPSQKSEHAEAIRNVYSEIRDMLGIVPVDVKRARDVALAMVEDDDDDYRLEDEYARRSVGEDDQGTSAMNEYARRNVEDDGHATMDNYARRNMEDDYRRSPTMDDHNKRRTSSPCSQDDSYVTGMGASGVTKAKVQTPQVPANNQTASDSDVIRELAQALRGLAATPKKSEMSSLADAIQDSLAMNRLPVPEPTVFTGDPLMFVKWKLSFQTIIGKKKVSAAEKMYYLQKYLSGPALRAIEGYTFKTTEESYNMAMETLEDRFGHPFMIQEAFRDKLDNWAKISSNNGTGLRDYADFLKTCLEAKERIPGLRVLNDYKQNQRMASKLPDHVATRWNRRVTDHLDTHYQYPNFSDFVDFVHKEARIACNPVTSYTALRDLGGTHRDTVRDSKGKYKGKATTFSTSTATSKNRRSDGNTNSTNTNKYCKFCKASNHYLPNCPKLESKPLKERKDFILEQRLCFGCLRTGHQSRDCPGKHTCKICKKSHPTLLHESSQPATITTRSKSEPSPTRDPEKDQTAPPTEEPNKAHSAVSHSVKNPSMTTTSMIVPVWISSEERPSEILTYAILDSQSDSTFIAESLATRISNKLTPVRLSVRTITSPHSTPQPSKLVNDVFIRGMKSEKGITIRKAYTQDFIPAERSQIPTRQQAENWPHLQGIASEISELQDCEIGLLVGTNCPAAGIPREVIVHHDNEPYAVRTDLGWSIVSGSESLLAPKVCHKVKTTELPEVTPQDLLSVLHQDFNDQKTEDSVSQEDLKFIQIMDNGIKETDNGHLSMPLPFKAGRPDMPDNKRAAEVRLAQLQKKFKRDTGYYEEYKAFVNRMIEDEVAEKVDTAGEPLKTWYLPHHGVIHPKKKKIRVVFDCAAAHGGMSLNDQLLKGPDWMSSLFGVLCRFREHPVAIAGDIEKMFHQFIVHEEDRDYLRFLWWENGNMETEPSTYRMKVHLFGATSSPACAGYGLRYLARRGEEEFPRAARFMLRNFYVDDGLQSCVDDTEAILLIRETQKVCRSGGLRLHKFVSNSDTVLQSVKSSERASGKTIDLYQGSLPTESVLGVHWSTEEDILTYTSAPKENPATRRGILSTVSSIFDPLGFIAPVVLTGKLILQEMCANGTRWDDPLPEELQPRWEAWKEDCANLERIRVPRCVQQVDDNTTTELHHFSDASSYGYGQCSYIRQVSRTGQVSCHLLSAKARVAPLKMTTIPRLELTAALVSASMSHTLKEELDIKVDQEFFWTDSQVVLSYISNESRRFHVFVANRVSRIRQLTQPEQWHHVPTKDNPADHASRGMKVTELMESSWFNGPTFLHDTSWKPPEETGRAELTTEDPEVRRDTVTCHRTSSSINSPILERLKKFPTWTRAVCAVARLQRFLREKSKSRNLSTPNERQAAKEFILGNLQHEAFGEEIDKLQKGQQVTSQRMKPLNPFLDEQGLLRVGGRLRGSKLPDLVKHPAIIPKEGHITRLLIQQAHEQTRHMGRGLTQNQLRSNGYWILGGSSTVHAYIRECVTCRRLRRPNEEQHMADLPEERVEPSAPFTYTGMDVFGPFLVKKGRSDHKRYGLLLTCLCSRAVHIEMLEDMSTDCLINALRCFIALRGSVRQLRCDQGTNFVGAKNEFKAAMKTMDSDRIEVYLAEQQCEFILNAPCSSHAGGVWERQIRTIRSILDATISLCPGRLDDVCLRTFLYEAMAIINSRPLSVAQINDATAPEPLTPNHILQMKSQAALPPPGEFVKEDLYLSKRWKRVQYLSEVFWGRWRREYLLSLNERQKWNTPRRNLRIGDIVIMEDQATPRMEWPLAMVTEATPGKDGLVRRVKVTVGTRKLDKNGRRRGGLSTYERPIQKLVLLLEDQHGSED